MASLLLTKQPPSREVWVFPDLLRDFGVAEIGETSSHSLGDMTEFL